VAVKLVTVEELLARMGFEEDDLSDEYLVRMGLALDAATVHLEAQMRTTFKQETLTERFSVNPAEFPYVEEYPYLYLKKGIVDSDAPFIVRTESLYAQMLSGSGTTLVPLRDYIVDAQKGLVMLTGNGLLGIPGYRKLSSPSAPFYAEVTYTAGMEDTNGVYEDVPEWLKEAAFMVGTHMYKRSGECSTPPQDMRAELGSLWGLVEAHVRYHPYALKAML
jgi:hypothetical protein